VTDGPTDRCFINSSPIGKSKLRKAREYKDISEFGRQNLGTHLEKKLIRIPHFTFFLHLELFERSCDVNTIYPAPGLDHPYDEVAYLKKRTMLMICIQCG